MERLISLVIGYGFGCIQTAYFAGKILKKIDIREYGSGNAGTTNVTRVIGLKEGIVVFAVDMIKAVIAYILCSIIFNGSGSFLQGASYLPGLYAGLGVILGHDFPFYLDFRGGKGAASTIGILLCLDFRIALLCCLGFFVAALLTKFISLGSLVVFALLPVGMIIFGYSFEAVLIGLAIGALGYYCHRTNIARLLSGKESKFSLKKK